MGLQFSRHDDYFCALLFRASKKYYAKTCSVTILAYICTPKPQERPSENPGNIAQLVEHSTENAGVVGSIPTVATIKKARFAAMQNGPFLLNDGYLRKRSRNLVLRLMNT
jgi:hypothetical protein